MSIPANIHFCCMYPLFSYDWILLLRVLSENVAGAGQCVPMYLPPDTPHDVIAPTGNLKLKWAKSSLTTS
jgi:predicted small lipoprotein YifL